MEVTNYLQSILLELKGTTEAISNEDSERLVETILKSKKIFVAGAGRSGFMGKSFAMRMMHMGLQAYVVGETVTPSLESEDLFVIGSGSGETKTLISMVEKAKNIGATIAVITINPDSTLGKLADIVIKIPGSPKDQSQSTYETIQPMGSLFEQTLLVFYDAVILSYMEKTGQTTTKMYGKHANLE